MLDGLNMFREIGLCSFSLKCLVRSTRYYVCVSRNCQSYADDQASAPFLRTSMREVQRRGRGHTQQKVGRTLPIPRLLSLGFCLCFLFSDIFTSVTVVDRVSFVTSPGQDDRGHSCGRIRKTGPLSPWWLWGHNHEAGTVMTSKRPKYALE